VASGAELEVEFRVAWEEASEEESGLASVQSGPVWELQSGPEWEPESGLASVQEQEVV
jgi:hypothetical protein